MASRLYYEPANPSAFWNWQKIQRNVKNEKRPPGDIRAWLEKQDAYTLHRPVRKRIARNAYSVNNVIDVREYDIVDLQALGKLNDKRYILFVIDVFYKFLIWSL